MACKPWAKCEAADGSRLSWLGRGREKDRNWNLNVLIKVYIMELNQILEGRYFLKKRQIFTSRLMRLFCSVSMVSCDRRWKLNSAQVAQLLDAMMDPQNDVMNISKRVRLTLRLYVILVAFMVVRSFGELPGAVIRRIRDEHPNLWAIKASWCITRPLNCQAWACAGGWELRVLVNRPRWRRWQATAIPIARGGISWRLKTRLNSSTNIGNAHSYSAWWGSDTESYEVAIKTHVA